MVRLGVVPVLLHLVAMSPHEFKLLHDVRDILCGLTFVAEDDLQTEEKDETTVKASTGKDDAVQPQRAKTREKEPQDYFLVNFN